MMHPKSFNSPVFVIRKRNSKDRKIANFKSTHNKVLIDIDPYLEQIIDSIGVGESNKYFAKLDGYW